MRLALLEPILDLLYPPACWACEAPIGRQEEGLCPACPVVPLGDCCLRCAEPEGAHAHPDGCGNCRGRTLHFRRVAALGRYEKGLKEAVHRAKFGGRAGAWDWMGRRLAGAVSVQADLVVPVPSSPAARRKRGYNPAEVLARPVARQLGKPCRDALRRRGDLPQVGLGRQARLANVEGAFSAAGRLEGLRVLLVDDVMTTGATVDACAAALKAAGAASVDVAVVAR